MKPISKIRPSLCAPSKKLFAVVSTLSLIFFFNGTQQAQAAASVCFIQLVTVNDDTRLNVDANYAAQTFTVSSACNVTAVGLHIRQGGTGGTSPVTVGIFNTSSGNPSTEIEQGTTITGNSVWATSTFSGTNTLSSGTTYAWVASSTGGTATNFWGVDGQDTVNTNSFNSSDGATWTAYGANFGYEGEVDGTPPPPPPQGDPTQGWWLIFFQ